MLFTFCINMPHVWQALTALIGILISFSLIFWLEHAQDSLYYKKWWHFALFGWQFPMAILYGIYIYFFTC